MIIWMSGSHSLSFLILRPNEKVMHIFSFQQFWINLLKFGSSQSGYNCLIWPPNEKPSILYFIKFQKIYEIKCPQFFIRDHLKKVMATLWKSKHYIFHKIYQNDKIAITFLFGLKMKNWGHFTLSNFQSFIE